jgi:hypothetical protein
MKELVAQRIPPGDRWVLLEEKKGEVYIEDGVDKPQPIKKYSLYGEEV